MHIGELQRGCLTRLLETRTTAYNTLVRPKEPLLPEIHYNRVTALVSKAAVDIIETWRYISLKYDGAEDVARFASQIGHLVGRNPTPFTSKKQ